MRVGKIKALFLKSGKCFKYRGHIYMRDVGFITAVRLTSKRPGGIIDCEQKIVTPVKIKIVEEK